jgi:dienelactone hydrolase
MRLTVRLPSLLVTVVVVATATACTTWVSVPPESVPPPSRQLAAADSGTFAYDLPAPRASLEPAAAVWSGRHHHVSRLRFDSAGQNGQHGNAVEAEYYTSLGDGPRPVVIVLPLWGTSDYPPSAVTKTLLKRGGDELHVVRVLGEEYIFDWAGLAASATEAQFRGRVSDMAARMRTTVVDLRRLIDWLEVQPEVDPERIGIVGFSMSAVVAAQLLGADDRLRSAVLMMGGAHLEQIVATCNGPLEQVRREIMDRFGWTLEHYEAAVGDSFGPVNPIRFPAKTPAQNILMIDAYYDECMPASSRDAFWEALGRPRRLSMLFGHRQSFWSLTPIGFSVMRGTVYRALAQSMLEMPATPHAPQEPVRAATAKDEATQSARRYGAP